ncbi:sushi, nidogen and EGF-like domain-containing protein 1 [Acanthaster planci]|uniref:Sushi, nidogen and EGF-like domain-containing protein 1 n=1 Tax=Acanthaster planci TaxID=133434 RepID=A0A8B7YU70_ACAPL|nr:sushi, nidogen and EGF-like domain-containing protein 1 [Acanthaster planci]
MVAPFWADMDVRYGGNVTYRELTCVPENDEIFAQADCVIKGAITDQSTFSTAWMFIATWSRVPFYGASGHNALNITNTFQVVLVTNRKISFAIFNYGEINWPAGVSGGGSIGPPAQIGVNAVDNLTFITVPGSRTNAIVNIDQDSNIGRKGCFLFRIDCGNIIYSGM